MITLFVWAASTAYVLARSPWSPATMPDSLSYLTFDPARPPAYGWMLQAYAWARHGDGSASLGGLPLLQAALVALALLAFARQLDRLFRSRWAGSFAVLAVWANPATYEATRWVASEALFLAAALLGLAASLAYARRGDPWSLAGCTASFALSALTRNAGLLLLTIPALLALLDRARPLRRRLAHIALAGAAASSVIAAGALDTHARHGRFALGSNSGVSLLGKGLLLQPAPGQDPVLAAAADRAAEARAAIAAAPGLLASLRAQAQAYELLRWPSSFPAADEAWPDWREADSARRNAIAARIAREAIAAAPGGYAALVARDWLALVLLPHLWPQAPAGGDSDHGFFSVCRAVPLPAECWAFAPLPIPGPYKLAAPGVSLGGLVASFVLLAVALPDAFAGEAVLPPAERAMLAFVAAAQGTLLGTALFEAGLWRYVVHSNAMNAALLVWLARRALGRTASLRAAARQSWGRASGARPGRSGT